MLWLLFSILSCEAFQMSRISTNRKMNECLLTIADNYLDRNCLSFLFPVNYSNPSAEDVPELVRSGFTKNLQEMIPVRLPVANSEESYVPMNASWERGSFNYLQCSHVIVLREGPSYVKQIDNIFYGFYGHHYKNGGGEKTKMVVATTEEVNETKVYEVLNRMFHMGDLDVVFVGMKNGTPTIFTLFPYGKDCDSCPEDNRRITFLDSFENNSFRSGENLFPNKVPERFKGCFLWAGTVHTPPVVFVGSDGEPFDGMEYIILEILAVHLGMKTKYIGRTREDGQLWVEGKKLKGSMVDVRSGRVWLFMAGSSNNIYNYHCVYAPYPYLMYGLTLFFRNPEKVPTWKLIYLGFSPYLWFVVILSIALYPISMYVLARIQGGSKFLKRLSECVIVTWAIAVGNSTGQLPSANSIRLLLATWLFYTMHVNQAYTASLAGLMTAGKMEPQITTYEQVVDKNLRLSVHAYASSQLAYIEEPMLKKVFRDFEVFPELETAVNTMMRYNNISVLSIDQFLSYKMKVNQWNIYKSNLNVASYPAGMIMRRNHFMTGRISELLSRIYEAGIINKIAEDFTKLKWSSPVNALKPYNLKDLAGPFFLLFLGYFLSIIVFVFEILSVRFKKYYKK